MEDDKIMADRFVNAALLERTWQDIEPIYGKEATDMLKELVPADPMLLHDMMVYSHQKDGRPKEEIEQMLKEYTQDDWLYDMKHFAKTIKKLKKNASKQIKSEH